MLLSVTTKGIIDTRSDISLISYKFIKNKNNFLNIKNTSSTIAMATESTQNIFGTCFINITINKIQSQCKFYVVKNLIFDVIIGLDIMSNLNALINVNYKKIY